MSRFFLPTVASMLLLLTGSCDTSFNPSAPSQPRMVVYSILRTDSDTQYVRVYSTYNPPDNDPTRNTEEVSINDAQVTIVQEGRPTFSFQPMMIQRLDTSHYSSSIEAYYAYPFRAESGKTYTLTVSSATMGTVTAKTPVPGQGTITPINPAALADPVSASNHGFDFGAKVALSPGAEAFLVRIYIDYLYPEIDGTYQPRRFEIPLRRDTLSAYRGLYEETFPGPRRRSTPSVAPVVIRDKEYKPEERVSYSSRTFRYKVDNLYDQEGCVHFKQAVFYLIQFNGPLWKNYSVANAAQNRFTVRVHQPDYTNIKNGAGVFGGMTGDSTSWPLPKIIAYDVPPFTAGCQ